jgi:hypothetical protein
MATKTRTRKSGLTLSYRKTLEILTLAFLRQFPEDRYERDHAESLARQLAEELLRPALSEKERARLDAMRARELKANGKLRA